MAKMIGSRWTAMSGEEKDVYNQQHEAAKMSYDAAMVFTFVIFLISTCSGYSAYILRFILRH